MRLQSKGGISSYELINYIIAGVIVLIIIYSGIFSASSNSYPVQCVHEQVTGLSCPSCGISRSLSEIVRFNFDEARNWNIYGPRVFLFFLFQLVLRLSNIFYLKRNPTNLSAIIRLDIAISIVSFLLGFWQFIVYNANLLIR